MFIKYLLYTSLLIIFLSGCSKDTTTRSVSPPVSNYNVNAITDVQYGENTSYAGVNEKLSLNIYSPKDASATKKYPLIVMAHGGSFLIGNKNSLATLCEAIAEKGYIAVSIDYRLGWDYGNSQSPIACKGDTASLQKALYRSLQDYNAALRFLVHDANKYFIDPNWIFIGGSSAGAVAAINTTYVTTDFVDQYFKEEKQQLGGLKNADNNLTDNFVIQGDISLWGAVINPDLITQSTAKPMVAFHGSADQTIPINVNHYSQCDNYPLLYGSQYIYNTLRGYGVSSVLHIAENQGHEPAMYQDPGFISDNVSCFIQSLMNKTVVTGTFQNLTNSCP